MHESKRISSIDEAAKNSFPHPGMESGSGPRIGFSTAGLGTNIVISEDSLAKATKVLNGLAPTSIHDSDDSSVAFFDTASKAKACVTFDSDLAKVHNSSSSAILEGANRAHSGFSTAGKGVTIAISEESLTNATALLRCSDPASSIECICTAEPAPGQSGKEMTIFYNVEKYC